MTVEVDRERPNKTDKYTRLHNKATMKAAPKITTAIFLIITFVMICCCSGSFAGRAILDKGRVAPTKQMNLRKSLKGWGDNPKTIVADFEPLNRAF